MGSKYSGGFIVDTSDIQKKINKIKKTLNDPSGAFTKTLSDVKRRAPGKVADAVVENYWIKKKEIIPQNAKAKTKKKLAGSIKVKGEEIANLTIEYSGRLLTLTHFVFSPTKVPKERGYKVKEKIRKTKKVTKPNKEKNKSNPFILKSPQGIVMPFQRRLDKKNKENPYYRKKDGSDGRMNQSVVSERTTSLPQMVDDKKVREEINSKLGDLLHERFNHHFGETMNKLEK